MIDEVLHQRLKPLHLATHLSTQLHCSLDDES